MIVNMTFIALELISIFLCIFHVFGKKPYIGKKNVLTFILLAVMMFGINVLRLHSAYSLFSIVIFFLYCLWEFQEKVFSVVAGFILAITITTIIQGVCVILVSFIGIDNIMLRDTCGILLTLFANACFLPEIRIYRIREGICQRHWLVYLAITFWVFVVAMIFALYKVGHGLAIGLFIFGIPAAVIMLFLLIYWDKTVVAKREMEKELLLAETMQDKYEELIKKVRINQHGYKNHIMAVYSSHRVCRDYNELVELQKDYCKTMDYENKLNNILMIANPIIGGFLYEKLSEIESKGVKFTYRIGTGINQCEMPYYYLIEILGILLDNAAESCSRNLEEEKLRFFVEKAEGGYSFDICNTHEEVCYEAIQEWFRYGVSGKKNGNGLGLYDVKVLCKKYNARIICENRKMEGKNWICFQLLIKAKGDDI